MQVSHRKTRVVLTMTHTHARQLASLVEKDGELWRAAPSLRDAANKAEAQAHSYPFAPAVDRG